MHLERFHGVSIERRDEDDIRRFRGIDLLENLKSVHVGHLYVEKNKIRLETANGLDRLATARTFSFNRDLGIRLENFPDSGPGLDLIIDNHDTDTHDISRNGIRMRATAPPW